MARRVCGVSAGRETQEEEERRREEMEKERDTEEERERLGKEASVVFAVGTVVVARGGVSPQSG
jgi:hypothetical protein